MKPILSAQLPASACAARYSDKPQKSDSEQKAAVSDNSAGFGDTVSDGSVSMLDSRHEDSLVHPDDTISVLRGETAGNPFEITVSRLTHL